MRRQFDRFVLWFYAISFGISLLAVQSLIFRRKMSHNNGIAAAGKLRIVDHPRFPDAEFFEPGREFPCRIRHASASYMDDAMTVVRSASIKFSDNAVDSPFDINMNTGRSIFWSAWNFIKFFQDHHEHGGTQYTSYYRDFPAGRDAAQDSLARDPESFSHLDYRSQTPFQFNARDGKRRYVNFRLIPADGFIEPMVNRPDQIGIFFGDQRTLPGETRNRNYLKNEYAERLNRGPVEYTLQLQLHEATDHDSELIFCSAIEWDEATHPWMELAQVKIDRLLSYEEGLLMYFSLNHHPKSVSCIEPTSIHDYNSLNYMRANVDFVKRGRLLAYKWFGMPKPVPDNGPRNVNEYNCDRLT